MIRPTESAARDPGERVAILVVDDDPGIRTLLVQSLERAGYRVVAAERGEEAIAALGATAPALVISDVHMPGLSGYEVCRAVRQRLGDHIPFIFLSGTRTEPYDRVAGFEFGADDYVIKPFDPGELLARVRALLRRAGPPREAAGGDESGYALTPREREILELLANGFGQARIASQLVISPKTVGKHVEAILKKLGVHSRAEAVALAYRERLIDRG